ncbi:hypothetical protein ACFXOQ_36955, partial [Streptomyces californicus]
ADSMSTVFLFATGVALLALLLVLFWKEVPLRMSGGLQSAGDAKAADGIGAMADTAAQSTKGGKGEAT